MISPTLERELHLQLENMRPEAQQKVLEFARGLVVAPPRGVAGKELLHFAGTLSDEEARQMMADIDEACGKVEPDGW